MSSLELLVVEFLTAKFCSAEVCVLKFVVVRYFLRFSTYLGYTVFFHSSNGITVPRPYFFVYFSFYSGNSFAILLKVLSWFFPSFVLGPVAMNMDCDKGSELPGPCLSFALGAM